ncbi:hypothetical protein H0H92_010380 [Tricholoma furcatifolium]|nr:hypothetical protein H0H92_010380 [Tricholoma furcatifolium]
MSYYPPGWAPPYRGAAPPMPAYVSVSQQQWQMGSWQFNPAYNYHRYPAPQTQWMAGSSWGHSMPYRMEPQQPQQPPPNFNPYKKVIKPPSAEYLAMPLVANSLNLHGMVAKENPYGDEKDPNVPATPWIWNPATLQNDAPSLSTARKAKEAEVHKERAEIRQSSEPLPSYSASAAISSTSLARHVTDPSLTTSWSANNPSALKTTFTRNIIRVPPNESANASTASLDSTLVDRLDRLNINSTREPSQLGRHSSMPSMYSASTSITGAQMSDEPIEYLSPLPLVMPLETTPAKRPLARGATYPEISSQPLSTITETPVQQEPARYKSSSHSQDTPSRIRIYSNMPPVPQSAPSSQDSFHRPPPSRSDSYPMSASADRSFTRDYSHPASSRPTNTRSDSYPISTSNDIPSQEPPHTQRPSVFQQHTPPESNNPDPIPSRLQGSPAHTPFYAASSLTQRSHSYPHASRPRSHESSPSYSSGTSTPRNSSPEPTGHSKTPSSSSQYPVTPVSIHRRSSAPAPSSGLSSAASPPVYDDTPSRPAPVKHRRTYHPISPPQGLRRVGFWNRRGDHCTAEGYLVCAPYDESYPSELAAYPENEYQDHFGFRIAFEPTRPELPESLPRYGMPPRQPYRDFLTYTE